MLNQCQFIGNLGRDVKTRTFPNGGKVCNFSIAVTERWEKDGERKEHTEWVNIAVFNEGLIGVCEKYLHKGSKVYISGKMQTRKWQDKPGNDRYSTEVVLQGFGSTMIILDGKPDGGSGQQGSAPAGGMPDDDIPFICEWRI